MNCPKCESGTKTIDTREVQGKRQRKRLCSKGHFFYTTEVVLKKWDYIDPRTKHPGKGRATKARTKKLNPTKARTKKLNPTKARTKKLNAVEFQKKTLRTLADANAPDWVKEIYKKIQ